MINENNNNPNKKNVIFDILNSKLNSNYSSTSAIRTHNDDDDDIDKKKKNNYYLNHNIVMDKLNKSSLSNFKLMSRMKNIFPKTSQNA